MYFDVMYVHLPPTRGYVAADLDHIPELPAHAQLIDGSLILRAP